MKTHSQADQELVDGGRPSSVRRVQAGGHRRTYIATLLAGYGYTGIATVVNLALIPILVSGLGRTSYGIWLTTAALVQWGTFATGWLSPGFVKILGEGLARGETDRAGTVLVNGRRLYRSIGVAVITVAVVLSIQPELGFLGGQVTADVRAMILLAAAWLGFHIEAQFEVTALTAAQRLYVVHGIQSAVLLASGLSAAASVLLGFKLAAVAGSYAIAAGIGLVAYKVARYRLVPIRPRAVPVNLAVLRDISATTAPYALSAAGWVLLTSDIIILAFLTSPETVATYGIAYKVIETMLQITWRIADSTQPYIVEFDALDDRDGLRRLYFRTSEASIILGGSLVAVFFFLGDRLLTLWVGDELVADVSIIRLLCIYAVLQMLLHPSVLFPFSTARMRVVGRLQIVEGATKVILALALVKAIGTEGVVLASIGAIVLLTGWYVPRFTLRLLDVAPKQFLRGIASHALPLPVLVGLAAWISSEVVSNGNSTAGFASAAGILAAGIGLGAVATYTLRSKVPLDGGIVTTGLHRTPTQDD